MGVGNDIVPHVVKTAVECFIGRQIRGLHNISQNIYSADIIERNSLALGLKKRILIWKF